MSGAADAAAPRASRLIVNADDFGLSPGVNRGILEAFDGGVLTSTTVLVNLEHFAAAAAIARQRPDLPVGVHLSLLWGRPVCDPQLVPTLVGENGDFLPGAGRLAARYFSGRIARRDVEAEFRAQLRRAVDAGIEPTHLDTHKHVHCLPQVFEAVLEVAAEFGIHRVRLPVESPLPAARMARPLPRTAWRAAARRAFVRLACRRARLRLAERGVRTTEHFLGLGVGSRLDREVLLSMFDRLPPGTTELMCHPGYADDAARRWSRRPSCREAELRALTDESVRLAARAVDLISFREI